MKTWKDCLLISCLLLAAGLIHAEWLCVMVGMVAYYGALSGFSKERENG